jgi:hypothetical protein
MNGYSVIDLNFVESDSLVGRAQIRSILLEGYQVPVEIVDWMLAQLERTTDLTGEIHRLEKLVEFLYDNNATNERNSTGDLH